MTVARAVAALGLAAFLAFVAFCFAHAPALTFAIAVCDVAFAIVVGKMLKHRAVAVEALTAA